MVLMIIIMIVNLIYIAQFNTSSILTALYMVIKYIETHCMCICYYRSVRESLIMHVMIVEYTHGMLTIAVFLIAIETRLAFLCLCREYSHRLCCF